MLCLRRAPRLTLVSVLAVTLRPQEHSGDPVGVWETNADAEWEWRGENTLGRLRREELGFISGHASNEKQEIWKCHKKRTHKAYEVGVVPKPSNNTCLTISVY